MAERQEEMSDEKVYYTDDGREIDYFFTVNGARVPVAKGQSKSDALKEFTGRSIFM